MAHFDIKDTYSYFIGAILSLNWFQPVLRLPPIKTTNTIGSVCWVIKSVGARAGASRVGGGCGVCRVGTWSGYAGRAHVSVSYCALYFCTT